MISRQDLQKVNREFRLSDESEKWPIRNKFNVTERAIRKARKLMKDLESVMEYEMLLDQLISEIVNDPRNW